MKTEKLDPDRCYQALIRRDRRSDGRFFIGVVTTGIYCRPVCPANKPRFENCRFFPCAAAAEQEGFRPCRRCRPETAPDTPAWVGTSATVARGLRMISEGALDLGSVEELARRLGVGARHLRRLFQEHLGTTPSAIAQTRRVHFAHQLLIETELSITEIAFASGFASVRRFNSALREAFQVSPSTLRQKSRHRSRGSSKSPASNKTGTAVGAGGELSIRVPYRPPFDWSSLLSFLAARALPGVEVVDETTYRRTFEVDGVALAMGLRNHPEPCHLELTLDRRAAPELLSIVRRVRRLFDLDADPEGIRHDLEDDPRLAPLFDRHPGLRVPGAWSGFEIGVRAILGQQVSVRGATTLAGRFIGKFGRRVSPQDPDGNSMPERDRLTHLFPEASEVAKLSGSRVASIGIPGARAETIVSFARHAVDAGLFTNRSGGLQGTVERLKTLPGIGDWTAQYIAMRGLGEPDAFPLTDLVLKRTLSSWTNGITGTRALEKKTIPWSPWRSYVAMAVWRDQARGSAPEEKAPRSKEPSQEKRP